MWEKSVRQNLQQGNIHNTCVLIEANYQKGSSIPSDFKWKSVETVKDKSGEPGKQIVREGRMPNIFP